VSDPVAQSSAFDLLAEPVRRWAWTQGWQALRDIQERAIPPIMAGRSVVLASATASGKTEAAFLPLLSRQARGEGLRVLYVSPLKALINDQTRRLEPLAESVGLEVTPWHGDVAASRKRRLRTSPSGILLITPESLEAMFVTRGSDVPGLFEGLDYAVVDELHSFIGTERGRQLQSLLRRLELAIGRELPRVGLSATLGDITLAASFLCGGTGADAEVVESHATRREVRIQIRGYVEAIQPENGGEVEQTELARDLYGVTSGGTHIVFANRRADVELYVNLLKRRCESEHAPDTFWTHHGSLAKDLREEAEDALRGAKPATVVATTTLELGIDVGSVDTIVQLGAPPSVSSMRQRLGRSGRRAGDPSVLRVLVEEPIVERDVAPQDELRGSLVQSVAMVELVIEGFNEAPQTGALHLSTLVQQVLSLCAQRGGFRADDAWRALCRGGPFSNIEPELFGRLLHDLAERDVLVQTHDGTIVLGHVGERLVNHYDFYSAFLSFEEYRLVVGPRTIGTLPISGPLSVDDLLLFAGRRWRVVEVRDSDRVIELEPAPGGRAPRFTGGAALLDDAVRVRMREVYESSAQGTYLDRGARDLLAAGRRAYLRLGLTEHVVLASGPGAVLFPWRGDRVLDTIALLLGREGFFGAARDGVSVTMPRGSPDDVLGALRKVAEDPPTAIELASAVANKQVEKHHDLLGEDLLSADYASGRLDLPGALATIASMLAAQPPRA
jgi:ATP-dependent Lhr-like helicase